MKIKLSKNQWLDMGRSAGGISHKSQEYGPSIREERTDELEMEVNNAWVEAISSEIQEDIEKTLADLDDIHDVDGFLAYLESSSTQFARYLLLKLKIKLGELGELGELERSNASFNIATIGMSLMNNIDTLSDEFIADSKDSFNSAEYGTYENFANSYRADTEFQNDPYKARGLMRNEF